MSKILWSLSFIFLAACSSLPVQERTFAAEPTQILYELPFDSKTEVVCTHSGGEGSHSYPNALYALDLANYSNPAAIVRAAAEGVAYPLGAEDGKLCAEPAGPPNKTEASQCGIGWGNRIKVDHGNGVFSFYVHLDHFLVKTGQAVKAGDPIGVMGATGLAGHRHLHWSVQKIQNGNLSKIADFEWSGNSIPFKFKAMVNGQQTEIDSSKLYCPHQNIGGAENQPKFTGLFHE